MRQQVHCIVAAVVLAAAACCAEAVELNGFIGPTRERAMEYGVYFEDRLPSIGSCARRCANSTRCKSFNWQARGFGLWVRNPLDGFIYELRYCSLSRFNRTSFDVATYELYDFYEETAEGPTLHDDEDAAIDGYIGPFTGMSTSGFDDITTSAVQVDDASACAALCSANSECRSFDYGTSRHAEGECYLSRVDRAQAGPAFTVWPLYNYYEKVLESISEVLEMDSRFSILANAVLQDSQLLTLLSGTGPFTVFAPTDEAFQHRAVNSAADLLATPGYRRLLEYHVVYGRFEANKLENDDRLLTAHGEQVYVNRQSGVQGIVTVGGARIVASDISCSNGLIHVVDGILSLPVDQEPESIMEMLHSRGFSSVQQAMARTGLDRELSELPMNWTFFAPSDTAVYAFRITEGYTDMGEFLDSPGLRTLLMRHIILNATIQTMQADSGMLVQKSMAGTELTLERTPSGSYFAHGSEAQAVAAVGPFDLWATDGILHAIDRVLAEPNRQQAPDSPRIIYVEVEKESDDNDDESARGWKLALALIALIILCCPCLFFAVYRCAYRRGSQSIEKISVQQDGVTVVMGKPMNPTSPKGSKAADFDVEAVPGVVHPGSNDAAGSGEEKPPAAPTYARAPTR